MESLLRGGGQSVAVGLGLGFDGDLDDGIRDVQGFQNHGSVVVAEGVAGGDVLEAHESDDVAGAGPLDFFTLVGVHAHDTADAFGLAGGGVQHGHAGFHIAGVHAEEGEVADVGVGGQLEHEAGQRSLVVGGGRPLLRRVLGFVPFICSMSSGEGR